MSLPEKTPRKKANGRANRERGHRLERDVAKWFRSFFPNVYTSRAASRLRDNQGLDLCHGDEITHGRMPVSVQCKSSKDMPKAHDLLEGLREHPLPIIWWQRVTMLKIGKKNVTNMARGQRGEEYVFMHASTFKEILEGYLLTKGIQKQDATDDSNSGR